MPDPSSPDPLAAVTRPFRAAIFDCDGTLADTMPLHYRAWVETLQARDAAMAEQLFYDLGGVPTVDIVRILNDRFGYALEVEQTAEAKEARYEELLHQAPPVERVVELVHEYALRYPLAVASGGLRRLVELTLEGLGLAGCFRVVCTAEDVERGKPHPDLFLLAARRLGVPPEDCVVFEDSDLGLEAARRAGMQPVDIRPWLPERRGG
ncbi:MAG TPA: HAD family phosphatase [Armatimonadota bacterium]|nr:HAD family phosphatase [Armatimonadota bacterium]